MLIWMVLDSDPFPLNPALGEIQTEQKNKSYFKNINYYNISLPCLQT